MSASYVCEHPDCQAEGTEDRIRDIVMKDGASLNMSDWHTCDTTHCLAGWAQHLEGDPEADPQSEGTRLIWPAAHLFFASNSRVREFLEAREYDVASAEAAK